MLSFGALLGDMTKSFFKRRLGYERGAKFPLVDQLDFVAGAWILTYAFDPVWFSDNFLASPWIMVTVVLFTPLLHQVDQYYRILCKIKKGALVMTSLTDSLKECKAIKFGDFTLASGKKSNYYIDIKKAIANPTDLKTDRPGNL